MIQICNFYGGCICSLKLLTLNRFFQTHQNRSRVVLTSYARTQTDGAFSEKRPAVIVLHGGGYYMKSITEYTPVALRFMAEGYQAFTLDYSLLPTQYPQQLLELAAAVSYLRNNAKKYSIDCNRIILCRFFSRSPFSKHAGKQMDTGRTFFSS